MNTSTIRVFADAMLLQRILLYLPWVDLVNAADVCTAWRTVARGPECNKQIQLQLTWLKDERFSSFNPFDCDEDTDEQSGLKQIVGFDLRDTLSPSRNAFRTKLRINYWKYSLQFAPLWISALIYYICR